jgi:bifunctional oligoribonuclease and PAP phosphatase NrnA
VTPREKTISQIREKIDQAKKILIPISGRLDGDGVGSALALAIKLTERGKQITCICDSPLHFPYSEFPGVGLVQITDIAKFLPDSPDVVIVTDASAPEKLLGDNRPKQDIPWFGNYFTINIDHHDSGECGDLNLIESSNETNANTILIYEILDAWNFNREIATLLYAGLVQDTKNFTIYNLNKKSFTTAANLIERGADITKVRIWFETFTPGALEAIQNLIPLIQTHTEIPYSSLVLPYEICSRYQTSDLDLALDYLKEDFMWKIRGPVFALTLREAQPGFVKGSLRGNKVPIDLKIIAKVFEGGGHDHAAGFKIDLPLREADILVRDTINKYYIQSLRS